MAMARRTADERQEGEHMRHEQRILLCCPGDALCKLSGGQKARVVFASIALQQPHILLMDEPTKCVPRPLPACAPP